MSSFVRCTLALVLILATPVAALAQQRGGSGQSSGAGGGSRSTAPVNRAPAPASRPAQQPRQMPSNSTGFNFNHDINARPATPQQRPATPQQRPTTPQRPTIQQPPTAQQRPATPQQRPAAPQQRPVEPQRPIPPGNATQRTVANYPHASYTTGGGPYYGRFHGPVIVNPRHWNGAWGWNRGVVWRPVPTYWAGGFWGPLAVATLTTALLYGSIADYNAQVIYPSYQIQPDSPGAQLLQNYGLQQTPCGPPNLVVIWGPNNSVICAYPNNLVGPGNYELDPSTLTIVSESP